ncbi:MAG: tetratricopeptide repeat protein [Chloroflexi bacterium]|nr:tetratricopeptide repeat protein [Ardenticatenaceae bacterium]MBL1127635.1 tetratricopeptide repeat protein [Chloroflexota bacterium]NOG33700.1 tetratricopeptide repeat protein [Chloroflexota bacterium]GIK56020.1 MAG: hypothetical protein BroJett015_16830 [Chloroflexota bacterium]
MINLAPATFTNEWVTYRQRRLPEQLRRLMAFVQDCQSESERARPHFHTIHNQLRVAQDIPDCHSVLAELVLALHPWPKWWGYWEEWLAVCQQVADILAQLGQTQAQGWLLADVVEMLFELSRYEDALVVLEQIFTAADNQPEMARPLCRAGHTAVHKLISLGRGPQGEAIYERQMAWLARWQPLLPADDYLYAHALIILQETFVMRRRGIQDQALPLLEALRPRLAAWVEAPLDLWRDFHFHHSGVLYSMAVYPESVAVMEQAIACAAQMGDEYGEATLYADKANPLWAVGEFDQAETAVRRSIYLCEKLRANWRLVRSISIFLDVLIARGALDEAMLWLARQMELTQQLQDEAMLSDAYMVRALVYMQRGHYDLALADLQVCAASYRRRGSHRWLVWAQVNMSWCYSWLGDGPPGTEGATGISLAQHSLQLSRDVKAENVELLALRCVARFQTGPEKQATLEQAVLLAQKINSLFNEAACLFDLVGVVGDTAVQQIYWQRAVALLGRCGVTAWLEGHTRKTPPCLPLIG